MTLGSWRSAWVPDPGRLREIRGRWNRVLVLSAVTGALVGLAVSGFEWITARVILEHVGGLPQGVQVILPAAGLVTAALALRRLGGGCSPSTSEEYTRAYHNPSSGLNLRHVPARVIAAVATLGTGGAMGFEGPSIYLGASVGSALRRRFTSLVSRDDQRVLLVAGAAAGIAAIFKAPATGAVFALEVPYQQDTASHALLPALVASASSYLTYVAFYGITPLLTITGNPHVDAPDLLGALALGLFCGIGARLFVKLILAAKHASLRIVVSRRLVVAGIGLAAVGLLSIVLFDRQIALGPGYRAIEWSLAPDRGLALIAALFVLDAAATALTIFGGGAGGVFIPLVTQGWLLGRFVEGAFNTHTALFPVVGAAAFLGAGYRTPFAAVVFVTETTHGPGFIVPALLATVISQLVMGNHSISEYQRVRRVGPVELRLETPVDAVMDTDPPTCEPEQLVRTAMEQLSADATLGSLPVVEDRRYLGLLRLTDVATLASADHHHLTVRDLMRTDVPTVDESWTTRAALAAMEAAKTDQLAVLRNDRFAGVVTSTAILKLLESDAPG